MLRTTISEEAGEAIDRLCEEDGVTPTVWMRSLVLREIRMQGSVTGGAVYGCACGHRRHRHRVARDRDGEFYEKCTDCEICQQYRQASPPEKRPS